jgi:hypothetical protein
MCHKHSFHSESRFISLDSEPKDRVRDSVTLLHGSAFSCQIWPLSSDLTVFEANVAESERASTWTKWNALQGIVSLTNRFDVASSSHHELTVPTPIPLLRCLAVVTVMAECGLRWDARLPHRNLRVAQDKLDWSLEPKVKH